MGTFFDCKYTRNKMLDSNRYKTYKNNRTAIEHYEMYIVFQFSLCFVSVDGDDDGHQVSMAKVLLLLQCSYFIEDAAYAHAHDNTHYAVLKAWRLK